MLEPSEFRFFGSHCLVIRSPNSAHEALLLYRRHSAKPGAEQVADNNTPLRILRLLTSNVDEYSASDIGNAIAYAGTNVGDYLRRQVADLRENLGDDASSPTLIRTVRGFGYQFCSPVQSLFGQEGARKWNELGFGLLPELLAVSETETPEQISSRAAGLHALGVAAATHGREEQAEPFLAEALALYSALDAEVYDDVYGDPYDEPLERPYAAQQAECQVLLGEIAFNQKKYESAKVRFEHVHALCERICLEGFQLDLILQMSKWRSCFGGKAALRLIEISFRCDSLDAAIALRGAKVAYLIYAKDCGWGGELASLYKKMALSGLARGAREMGKEYLYAAKLEYFYSKHEVDALATLEMCADLEYEDQDWESAESFYELVIKDSRKLREKATEARGHEKLAEIAAIGRYGSDVCYHYEQAVRCYEEIGDRLAEERCIRLLEASRALPQVYRWRPPVWGGPSALEDY